GFDLNATAASAQSKYDSVNSGEISVTFGNDGTHDTITRAAGDFAADGFVAGQTINVTGAGGNNGDFTIFSVSANQLVLTSNKGLTGALTKTIVQYDS